MQNAPSATAHMRELASRHQATAHEEPQSSGLTRHQMGQGSTNQHTNRPQTVIAQHHTTKRGLQKRANVKIGTVNINRLHTITEGTHTFEKWAEVNATMKKEKIAILAVQETHLDKQNVDAIHQTLGKRLRIINSQLEDNPRTSAGVAFVLNKDLIDIGKLETHELIKGRAIAMNLTWKNEEETLLINVYTSNRKSDHQGFWEKVENERMNRRLRKPDFVLGDFNLTEEPINRFPAKHDNHNAITALREFRLNTGVQDEWRHAFPKAREYTYRTTLNDQQIKS